MPGVVATVLLTQIALVGTAFLALAFFPLISEKFFGRISRTLGHVFLVVLRSTPEFILVYIFLQLWGPSMLPAVVALAIHNGAIIGHLLGRYSDEIRLRPDSANASPPGDVYSRSRASLRVSLFPPLSKVASRSPCISPSQLR